MNTRDKDDLKSIPTMKPARDELLDRDRRSSGSRGRAEPKGGSPILTTLCFIVAITALGAAYFLWEQSMQTQAAAEAAEARIAELESQLANTGDELTQSDAAVRVKLKELDSEVRKLWDSRKKANVIVKEHGVTIKNLTTRTGQTRKDSDNLKEQLTVISAELEEMIDSLAQDDVASKVAQLQSAVNKMQTAKTNVEQLERRVAENEAWVESINAFRRQVNDRLSMGSGQPSQPELR